MKAKQRRLAAVLVLGICLVLTSCRNGTGGKGAAPEQGVSRCLVIGYDRFVTMEDTAPCSANNTEVMAALLTDFAPDPERVVRRVNEPGTAAGLEALIGETFRDAGRADASYLYISTHGVAWEENGDTRMALILSDGTEEEALAPERLRDMLDGVPGRKILIFDACHSGAAAACFDSPEYQVLASSAADEDSYFWLAGRTEGTGTGYFTSALENALRASRPGQIDTDGSGTVSMAEVAGRISEIYGASSAQCFPEGGSRPLFRFPEQREMRERILGLEFDTAIREENTVILPFRFTVTEATRIEYRIVTKTDGAWDFDHGTSMPDRERTGTSRGLLAPGDKERKIRISAENLGAEGEALLQIISMRGLHGQVPVLEGTCVIRK